MANAEHTWDLFIAHAGPDGPMAKELYALVHPRLRVFLDSECLKLGDDFDATLAAAQRASFVTVVLVSSNTEAAYYQREEIATAIAMARKDGEAHRVVPLSFGVAGMDAVVPYGLRLKHGLTLGDEFSLADAAEKLLQLVQGLRAAAGAKAGPTPARAPGGHRGMLHAPPDGWVSPVQRNNWRYKVVAFDLDGTLLRGQDFVFSWERVWGALRVSKNVQQGLRREYKLKAEAASTTELRVAAYRKWCEAAVAHFRKRGLTRTKLAEIAAPLELTANCREALDKLRAAGVVTAIISGGINTFLEDRFPDFRDHVDFAFLNELLFDADGVVEGVAATAYDFEGKADALGVVCSRAMCTEAEAVFVGDRFNDEAIMLHAHLSVAYPPMDKITADAAAVSILQDDLTLILPHIFVE